ncbi:hypothetical protein AB1Y20_004432 [Prymnesium parvum]|uniref:Uncharacterized protein n=1 Tax=Prymnesium parvum TaxID=97485 RepID=A0AB34IWQ1_PRYPA
MRRLANALEAAWAKGRTPLLVDATDADGSCSALESFYSYSGHQLLEMEKLVVQVGVTKEKTVEQALAEAREKLILSMKRGYN